MTETMVETQGNSLGQQLKAARSALGLSVEEVAQKTNLKKNHIESLENDIFILQNVAPTFVRGYVRNYLRFLRLPEELGASVNYGEVTIPKEVINKAPSHKAAQKSQSQWVKYLTIFVLFGAIAMTLLWWWQDYQTEQQSREQFVGNNTVVVESPLPAQTAPVVEPAKVEVPTATTVPTTEPVQSVENTRNVAPNVVATADPTAPVVNNENNALPTVQPVAQAPEQVNVLQQPQDQATAEQPVAMNNDELRIEVTNAQSWVTVRGAKNKRLAEKLYNAGETLSFNGNEQYRLTIGAPANVKIYYKGQEVPLKIDGRVARIRLPLAQ